MDSIDYLSSVAKLMQNSLDTYTQLQKTFYKNIKSLTPCLTHMHAVHAHPCCHTYDGQTDRKHYHDKFFKRCDTNCYETKFYPDVSPTPVSVLMREVSLKIDCDNNGKIFTEDFLFNKDDLTVPKILISMQRMKYMNISLPKYTWDEYLTTVSPNAFI